ncbi:potassium/proton antiporter [Maricaulaceae bacterium MS644]
MENPALILLAASGLVLMAIAGAATTSRAGAPLLLVFLSLGMLAGVEGPGGLDFHALDAAYLFGSLALALILFDGGLGTRLRALKPVLRPALMLATVGVVATTAITAVAARYLFALSWVEAGLMGAIVSSTDAAAVLALLGGRELKARARVVTTLEAESGFNDPVAVILVTAFVQMLAVGEGLDPLQLTGSILWALAAGGMIGWFGGRALAAVKNRVALPESLYPIFAVAGAVFLFALAQAVEASGFLAAYLAGVAVRAVSRNPEREATVRFSDGLAWLSQIGLFLMLGLLVVPSQALALAVPSLILALVLIFVARPLAVFACLLPERLTMKERGFIAWMGLRGAVPIFLGIFPVIAGVENANTFFSVAFAVVLVSLVGQGWTAGPITRLFGVAPRRVGKSGRQLLAGAAIAAGGFAALTAGIYIGSGLLDRQDTELRPQSVAELRQALARVEPDKGLALATLPPDFAGLPAGDRRALFVDAVEALAQAQNANILDDRAAIRRFMQAEAQGRTMSLSEQALREALARLYGGRYGDLEDLISRADIIPPRLAAAQAALATGYGSSQTLIVRNALFGGSGHETLGVAMDNYARLLNTHPDFAGFRARRAALRAAGEDIDAGILAGELSAYASGEGYVAQLRAILSSLDAAGG